MIVCAASLLARNPRPTAEEVTAGMDGHLCRCATYVRIQRAVLRVANGGAA